MNAERRPDEFRAALRELRRPLGTVLLFSGAINVLYLASPLYLIQIYGRVMNSGSVPTLVVLTAVLVIALTTMALLEYVRARVLVRVAGQFERLLSARVFEAQVTRAGAGHPDARGAQPLRDLDQFRSMIGGPVLAGLFDLPWTPLFVVLLFMLHPLFGLLALLGAAVLMVMTWLNVRSGRAGQKRADEEAARGYRFATAVTRAGEAVRVMGMTGKVRERWFDQRSDLLTEQALTRDKSESYAAGTRFARMLLQSLAIGLGGWLVLRGSIGPATIFAASILVGRALAPLVTAVAAWVQLDSAGDAVLRVRRVLMSTPPDSEDTMVPEGEPAVGVHSVSYMAPNSRLVLSDVSLDIGPGRAVGVIGPSGAGKSTLVRLIVGAIRPTEGEVKLFGRDAARLTGDVLGRRLGYLPQDVRLLPGTVRENIGRFQDADEWAVIAAAEAAGVHDLVGQLPQGYDTLLSEAGDLSGGEIQRLALARALYGAPDILALDEPDAALDEDGEAALCRAIADAKFRGAVVIVVTHRSFALEGVDDILVLKGGKTLDYGPKDDVVARQGRRPAHPAPVEEKAA